MPYPFWIGLYYQMKGEKKLELSDAQKIFGYFDKSYLVELFENMF